MNTSGYSSSFERNESLKKFFLLSDKCFENRAACTWRQGNQFTVYPFSYTTNKTSTELCDNKIMQIRQDVMLHSPILRKLVNESNGTFIYLQKSMDNSKSTDNQVEILKLSRQYRSIIRVCIESLQEASNKEANEAEKNSLLSYITIFYSIECLWHLCEILYIDNIPGDVVLPHLLEWVRFHFPCHEQTAAQLLEACEKGSESHPDYWDTVIGMMVQGRVDVARALLKLHSASDTNEFKLVDNSLRSMPVYSVYGGISSGEFTITWKHWQAECRAKMSSGALAAHSQLELIIRLITGDYSAFESVRATYDSWFDLLGGYVMFTSPCARRHELGVSATALAGLTGQRCVGVSGGSGLECGVRALLDGDLHQVIHDIQHMTDNGWFATHLTDLLYHCNKLKLLDHRQTDVTNLLRESLIVEYGNTLMDHKSLWTVGLSYMASCPEGRRKAEVLLERISVKDEKKALRIIAEAKRYGLGNAADSISSGISAHHLTKNRLGAALAWAIRGNNSPLSCKIADRGLRQYCETGKLPASDLLATIGPNIMLSDRLLLLGKYCEFHRLYKNKEFKNAGKLLISLMTSKIIPDYFWETLLLDTLPLLECDTPIFSSAATYETMALLASHSGTLTEDKADLLRLALVRNLAKASLGPDMDE